MPSAALMSALAVLDTAAVVALLGFGPQALPSQPVLREVLCLFLALGILCIGALLPILFATAAVVLPEKKLPLPRTMPTHDVQRTQRRVVYGCGLLTLIVGGLVQGFVALGSWTASIGVWVTVVCAIAYLRVWHMRRLAMAAQQRADLRAEKPRGAGLAVRRAQSLAPTQMPPPSPSDASMTLSRRGSISRSLSRKLSLRTSSVPLSQPSAEALACGNASLPQGQFSPLASGRDDSSRKVRRKSGFSIDMASLEKANARAAASQAGAPGAAKPPGKARRTFSNLAAPIASPRAPRSVKRTMSQLSTTSSSTCAKLQDRWQGVKSRLKRRTSSLL